MSSEDLHRDIVRSLRQADLSAFKLDSPEKRQADWNTFALRSLFAEQGRNLVSVIQKRIQRLEESLKPGEELVVYCDAGKDRVRVQAIECPNWHLAIVCGRDDDNNPTQRIANIQNIELTCKVMEVHPGSKPARIGFILPEITREKDPAER